MVWKGFWTLKFRCLDFRFVFTTQREMKDCCVCVYFFMEIKAPWQHSWLTIQLNGLASYHCDIDVVFCSKCLHQQWGANALVEYMSPETLLYIFLIFALDVWYCTICFAPCLVSCLVSYLILYLAVCTLCSFFLHWNQKENAHSFLFALYCTVYRWMTT